MSQYNFQRREEKENIILYYIKQNEIKITQYSRCLLNCLKKNKEYCSISTVSTVNSINSASVELYLFCLQMSDYPPPPPPAAYYSSSPDKLSVNNSPATVLPQSCLPQSAAFHCWLSACETFSFFQAGEKPAASLGSRVNTSVSLSLSAIVRDRFWQHLGQPGQAC